MLHLQFLLPNSVPFVAETMNTWKFQTEKCLYCNQ